MHCKRTINYTCDITCTSKSLGCCPKNHFMKHKLIFSVLFLFSFTFCHAQKLTPEILHGQWQAVAFYLPGELFYNSFTDSFAIENKAKLKEFKELSKNSSIDDKVAIDSLKKKAKSDIRKNILSFNERGDFIVSQENATPIFLFYKKKAKFRPADIHGGFAYKYLDASFQNGLLKLTLSDQSTSKTLWLQKIENRSLTINPPKSFKEVWQYLTDSISPKLDSYKNQPLSKLLNDLRVKIVYAEVDKGPFLREPETISVSSIKINFFTHTLVLLNSEVPFILIKFSNNVSVPLKIYTWGKGWDPDVQDFYKDLIVENVSILKYANKVSSLIKK